MIVNKDKPQLTLDQMVTYQIKVPGELDENWPDWAGEMEVMVESDADGLLISSLTGTLDQAALADSAFYLAEAQELAMTKP